MINNSINVFCALVMVLCVENKESVIYNFKSKKSIENWYIVDDGVMGGLSQGKISLNSSNIGVYSGTVRTENNGGFSSIRYECDSIDVSIYTHIVLKVKGDGKSYQFRIKESPNQRFSYITNFETTGKWQTIKLPLKEFYPSYRGYRLRRPNFNGKYIQEIAFLISAKTKSFFTLEIEYISLE